VVRSTVFGLALVGAFLVVGHLRPGVSAQDTNADRIAALETAVAGLTTRVADLEGEGGTRTVARSSALNAILTPQAPPAEPPPTPTPEPEPTAAPTPTERPSPIGTSADNPAAFGATAENAGVAVTLSNGYFAEAYGYSTPKGGYRYLVFDAYIEATWDDDRSYSPSAFSGEDAATGAGYDSAFVSADGMLGSDQLSRGEFVTGTVVLEVQVTAESVVIKYDPQQFDPNDIFFSFP